MVEEWIRTATSVGHHQSVSLMSVYRGSPNEALRDSFPHTTSAGPPAHTVATIGAQIQVHRRAHQHLPTQRNRGAYRIPSNTGDATRYDGCSRRLFFLQLTTSRDVHLLRLRNVLFRFQMFSVVFVHFQLRLSNSDHPPWHRHFFLQRTRMIMPRSLRLQFVLASHIATLVLSLSPTMLFSGGRVGAQARAILPNSNERSEPPLAHLLFERLCSASTIPCNFADLLARRSDHVFPSWPTSNIDNKNPARSAIHDLMGVRFQLSLPTFLRERAANRPAPALNCGNRWFQDSMALRTSTAVREPPLIPSKLLSEPRHETLQIRSHVGFLGTAVPNTGLVVLPLATKAPASFLPSRRPRTCSPRGFRKHFVPPRSLSDRPPLFLGL